MTAPTNDRQTSERERLANALERIGQIASSFDAAVVFEAAAQLRAVEAEIAQLRAERDEAFRMSRCECGTNECCANLVKHSAELDALRAENEALRTVAEGKLQVTDEDVRSAAERLDSDFSADWPGWTNDIPDEHFERYAKNMLQSFIRSKESRRG